MRYYARHAESAAWRGARFGDNAYVKYFTTPACREIFSLLAAGVACEISVAKSKSEIYINERAIVET